MEMEEEKKKLMLLGGNRYQLPVIKAAHEMGVYVITCDYLPDNIAHKYSDEYCNVSIIDEEAVLQEAKKRDIDGIMSFACDPGVTTAAYVAEKMGLPSVGSYKAVCLLQDKGKFRKFLTDNGFNVPVAKSYTDKQEALKDTARFNWPVIVKPTDLSGSKGVRCVEDPADLSDAIDHALGKSRAKEFIIEDFLEKKGCSSDADSFSVDGKLVVAGFNAQHFDSQATNPYTPSAFSWPTTISAEHVEELTNELQRLISLLDLKTSVYNIETRECTNGKAYIMECTPRGGGNRLSEIHRYMTGIDFIKDAVLAALGEDISYIKEMRAEGFWAEAVLHSDKDGVFNCLQISDEIRDNIIEEDLWVEKGDHIEAFDAASNAIGTLVMSFENEERMLEVINNIRKYIKIITE